MLPETLIVLGLVLIIVAILGAGLKVATVEVPQFATRTTRIAAIAIGVGVLAWGVYLEFVAPQFTVTKASISSDAATIDVCPSNVVYTVVIEVTGGTGSLDYRWVHDAEEEPVATLEFKGQTSRVIQREFEASDPLGNLGNALGVPLDPERVQFQVLAPNPVRSAVITTPKTCEFPPPPDVPPPRIESSGPPAPIELSSPGSS